MNKRRKLVVALGVLAVPLVPIEQPTKFELVMNAKTAKALGIKIPNSIMVQATKVIE